MKTFVVNLKRREDRKNRVIEQFRAHKFSDYSFFEAIDGNELEGTKEIYDLFLGNVFNYRKALIGCCLSQYMLYKRLISEDDETNFYGIFEDDFEIVDDFNKNYNKSYDYLVKNLEIDILFLGYHNHGNVVEKEEVIPFKADNYIGGFFSYIISKNGAKKILKYIDDKGFHLALDLIPLHISNFNMFEVNPFFIKSNYVRGDNSVDSDVQRNLDPLFFNYEEMYSIVSIDGKKYKYFCGLDSHGNDIEYLGQKPLHILAKNALLKPNCVAFNNLGFMKFKVEKISPGPWSDLRNNGLYVLING